MCAADTLFSFGATEFKGGIACFCTLMIIQWISGQLASGPGCFPVVRLRVMCLIGVLVLGLTPVVFMARVTSTAKSPSGR